MLQLRQSLHYCEDLFDRIPIGKGRHYHVADNHATQLIVQDSTGTSRCIRSSTAMPTWRRCSSRPSAMPLKFETLYVGEWKQNLLLAEQLWRRAACSSPATPCISSSRPAGSA